MSLLFRRQYWDKKPPPGTLLDPQSVYARHCTLCLAFNEAAEAPIELTGKDFARQGTGWDWQFDEDGWKMHQNQGSAETEYMTAEDCLPSQDFGTLVMWHDDGNFANSADFLFQNDGNEFVLRRASGNEIIEIGNSSETGARNFTNGGNQKNVVVWDTVAQTTDLWTNGAFTIGRTTPPGTTDHTGDTLFIGVNTGLSQAPNEFSWKFLAFFDFAFDTTDIMWFMENPWRIFQPVVQTLWIDPGTGGPITQVNNYSGIGTVSLTKKVIKPITYSGIGTQDLTKQVSVSKSFSGIGTNVITKLVRKLTGYSGIGSSTLTTNVVPGGPTPQSSGAKIKYFLGVLFGRRNG